MNTKPYYIQLGTFRTKDRSLEIGTERLVSLNYMGSAEFELGAYGKTIKLLRQSDLQLVQTPHRLTNSGSEQDLFVIGSAAGVKRAEHFLPDLLAGKLATKEYTALHSRSKSSTTNFWVDISDFVVNGNNNDHSDFAPFILVLGKHEAMRMFLELHHFFENPESRIGFDPDFRIGDKVFTGHTDHIGKIAGICENDEYVVKTFSKTQRTSKFGVWALDSVPVQKLIKMNLIKT